MSTIYDETLRQQHLILARAYGLSDQTLEDLESHHAELVALLAGLIAAYFPKGFAKATADQKQAFFAAHHAGVESIVSPVFSGVLPRVEGAATEMSRYMENGYAGILKKPLPNSFNAQEWAQGSMIADYSLSEWAQKQATTATERITRAGRDVLDSPNVPDISKATGRAIQATLPGLEDMNEAFLMNGADAIRQAIFPESAWRYTAILDGRTCGTCAHDHGRLFKTDQKRPGLPRHVRCRCAYTPVVVAGDASFDEPATYQDWLMGQMETNPAFVASVLSPARVDLLAKGKASMEKMVVDTKNRSL